MILDRLALARRLAQQLADGSRQRGRLAQVQRQAQEQVARRIIEKRIAAFARIERVANRQDVRHPHARVIADVPQGVVAVRLAVQRVALGVLGNRERIEQIDLLPPLPAELGRDEEVFQLHVHCHDRLGPIEQVRDDDADTLTRASRRGQQHELHAGEHQEAVLPLPDDDAGLVEQPGLGNLRRLGEAGFAVQRPHVAQRRNRQHDGHTVAHGRRHDHGHREALRHDRIVLVELPVRPPR
ncbi:hypothetical protein SDC9_145641 [bioreactor metagenome]|uniref:Uncharacterized protein n=1 Tax=bioreactor metagenome TaxID=1076179 RepID=A0A645ECG4_9ZZZZ